MDSNMKLRRLITNYTITELANYNLIKIFLKIEINIVTLTNAYNEIKLIYSIIILKIVSS